MDQQNLHKNLKAVEIQVKICVDKSRLAERISLVNMLSSTALLKQSAYERNNVDLVRLQIQK